MRPSHALYGRKGVPEQLCQLAIKKHAYKLRPIYDPTDNSFIEDAQKNKLMRPRQRIPAGNSLHNQKTLKTRT